MDAEYRLASASVRDDSIRKRARLLELVPVKDLERRGWIPECDTTESLERELCKFFQTDSLDSIPDLAVSTRKVDSIDELTPPQRAWCYFVRSQAAQQIVAPFDRDQLDACEAELQRLTAFAPEIRKVSQTLASFGVHFLLVESLPGAKIDGAAMWIKDKPVIALSLRYDRIDYFWFTVFHEWSHIRHGDSLSIDTDLVGKDATVSAMKSDIERRADNDAAKLLVPPAKIESFIHRVAPLYSKERIIQFAHRNKVHPGIVVGQLQHRGQISFGANREMLVPIRDIALSTSIYDGWGQQLH